MRDFTRRHRVSWPLISYTGMATPDAYGVSGSPVTFLVGPDESVAAKILGGLRAGQLDTLLTRSQSASRRAATAGADGRIAARFDILVRHETEPLPRQLLVITPAS